MGKRRKRKASSTLTWKAAKGLSRLFFKGFLKASPFVLLGGVGFGIFWGLRENLYADPGFLVQSLEVVPEKALSPQRIQELERRFLNRNLFKISPQALARELEADPAIREARVLRKFPKTLQIEISHRDPFVQIQFSPHGPYVSAAEDQVVLSKEFERNKKLLLIEAFEDRDSKPENGEGLSLAGFREAVELAKAFQTHPLARREAIERIRLDHLGNVTLVLVKGPELRFGRQPMKKFHTLGSLPPLLKGPDRDKIIYIELQYRDLIVKKQ